MFAKLPADLDLRAFYDDAYWTEGGHGYSDYDEEWKESVRFYDARLKRIESLQKTGRLLEIGCAAGYFLKAARADGWRVSGIEISETMRKRCAVDLDCPLYASIEEAASSGSRFDCVAMFEVIEHLTDPIATLTTVSRMMEPGALLALSTNNFTGPEALRNPHHRRLFAPPVHIAYFDPDTLPMCLRRAGFEVVALEGLFAPIEMPMPPLLQAVLGPIRRGKRLRPRGLLGKLIKRYQRSRKDAIRWTDTLELYARKV